MCFWRSLVQTLIGKKWGMIQGCNCYYLIITTRICFVGLGILSWKFHFFTGILGDGCFQMICSKSRWGVFVYLYLEPDNFDNFPFKVKMIFFGKTIPSLNPNFSHLATRFSNNSPGPKIPGFEDFIDLSWQDFRQQLLQVARMVGSTVMTVFHKGPSLHHGVWPWENKCLIWSFQKYSFSKFLHLLYSKMDKVAL